MFDEAADLVADLMEANDHLLTDPEERELRFMDRERGRDAARRDGRNGQSAEAGRSLRY